MNRKEEELNRRVNLISWMDDFIMKEITDTDLLKHWEVAFVDDALEEDIIRIAEDEDNWVNIVDTFAMILDEHWVKGDNHEEA